MNNTPETYKKAAMLNHAPVTKNRKKLRSGSNQNMFAYFLLLPSFIFLSLFTFYPTLKSVYLSFYSGPMTRLEFSGLDQYKDVLSDEIFRKVILNNILFIIGTVPASLFLAMYLAIWLNKKMAGSALLRTSFFYPTIIPLIAVANIWLFIYTPQYGLLAKFLQGIGAHGPNWLGSQSTVMIAMILMIIWKDTGFYMIFYLAGLQNLPKDVYESAMIEGAKPFQMFRYITFPLLMPTTLFVMIVAITNAFKNVDHLYIMTKGGPDNASNLLLYHIYEAAFTNWDLGKAAVLTVVLIAVLLSITAFNYLFLDKKIHY
ncbi:sn-glycerol 3-phosphate transport system permease protein [Fictibacillus barbaricus]|uniref:Sn-glycerol 3-phosphate transport system permease protein n=2 Tax=Fictibacillus barbaricus TaxID=182136 RepID=A0ABU1U386_9BACL|nr:sn-glycerol 3-phosphate transport system permease protein [Fictibacillus barbaricus]